MVLAQEKIADKSNEITAIPKLLAFLDLESASVTIDAMGCQKAIAQKIREKKAYYVLSLKGNQSTFHDNIKLLFKDGATLQLFELDIQQTVDGSEHGRIETLTYHVIEMPEVLKENHDWCDLKTLIEVISERDIKGVTTNERRYISYLAKNTTQLSKAIRYHWSIENSLH